MGAAEQPGGLSRPSRLLAHMAAHADAALRELRLTHGAADLVHERAALGASPAKSCRLLAARDGLLALNLARGEDLELMPAWLEEDLDPEWDAIERAVRSRSAPELVARGRELGLAVALDAPPSPPPRIPRAPRPAARRPGRARPRVVDFSSLWAGPLCGRLLRELGAEVLKVESAARPDGARAGSPEFFERLNGGKQQLALDFRAQRGALAALVEGADIVIEASRPRALRQLGLHAEAFCAANPQLTWISITGHGRAPETENWIAYGDDAGVAAGLSHLHFLETGDRAIVGDAVADPLTGIRAALEAWRGWQAGGAGLVSLSLYETVGDALAGAY